MGEVKAARILEWLHAHEQALGLRVGVHVTKLIKLSPGMNLTAEIKTGKRRVIEYLLSPVQRATSESPRER